MAKRGSKRNGARKTRRARQRETSSRSSRRNVTTKKAVYRATRSPQVRADSVLRRMQKGASLSAAARREGIKPTTVLRLVGKKLHQDRPGGRFRLATPSQSRIRYLNVPSATGFVIVPTTRRSQRRRFSDFDNAITHFNRTGDLSKLQSFKGKYFTTVDGERVEFVTDPATLEQLAEADALRIPDFYASFTSRT